MFREPNREPRRVGSGRLMSRDSWDSSYRQPENGISNNFNFGKGGFRESASHNSVLVILRLYDLYLVYFVYLFCIIF